MSADTEQLLNIKPAELTTIIARTTEFVAGAALDLEVGVGVDVALQNRRGEIGFNPARTRQEVALYVGGHPGAEGNFVIKHNTDTGGTDCTDFWTAEPQVKTTGSKLFPINSEIHRISWHKVPNGKRMMTGKTPATAGTILEMARGAAQNAEKLAESPASDRPFGLSPDQGLWLPQEVSVALLAKTAQIAASGILAEEIAGSLQTETRLNSGVGRLYWHARGRGVSATCISGSTRHGETGASFKFTAMPDIAVGGLERTFIAAKLSVTKEGETTVNTLAYEDNALIRVQSVTANGATTEVGRYPASPDTILTMAQFAASVALANPEAEEL